MAEAKTIKLLLSNGSLSGLLIAELLKWDGILFSSPRVSYQLLSNEPESKFWGVYLLVSETQVYIGQANDLLRRIIEHDKNKAWWDRVILLTTKDNSLNRSDIDFLENKLIEKAKEYGTLEASNIQSGKVPKVSRYRETELMDYLEGGLLLLELIGVKVFKHSQTNASLQSMINHSFDYINNMNKVKAIKILDEQSNLNMTYSNTTFASLQKMKFTFWANPNVKLLERKWYIILNDQFSKQLKLLEIPPNEFGINENHKKRLYVRKDRMEVVDLNINKYNLTDERSKVDFTKYIKKVVSY